MRAFFFPSCLLYIFFDIPFGHQIATTNDCGILPFRDVANHARRESAIVTLKDVGRSGLLAHLESPNPPYDPPSQG